MLTGSNGLEMDSEISLPPFHCATGNLSLRREAFRRIGGFDERFQVYGWEDTDFGYRAAQAGLRLLCNPRALSYHHDYAINFKADGERIRQAARSVWTLFDKHPELEGQLAMFEDKGHIAWRDDPPHIILRKLARSVMIWPPALWTLEKVTEVVEMLYPSPALLRPLYRWVIGTYTCLGYREGLKTRYG